MGEAKHRSRTREAIVAGEMRCIYCPGPAETLEHMPPMSMFRSRQRPSGMEYGACKVCNSRTRGSDAVAALVARLDADNGLGSWQLAEILKLRSAVDVHAPGVLDELSRPGKSRHEWGRRARSDLLQKVVRVRADGPRIKAHLAVFGAKLAMALYREHVGAVLPLDGAVWSQFTLNAGMTQENLNARVERLPIQSTLRQGSKSVGEQFAYRFNCDERTALAAVVQFHRGLWFTIFASSDQRIVELFSKPEHLRLPASAMVRPGDLVSLLPAGGSRARA
jgi:hypothetical protein